jgi:hypothetical protein
MDADGHGATYEEPCSASWGRLLVMHNFRFSCNVFGVPGREAFQDRCPLAARALMH